MPIPHRRVANTARTCDGQMPPDYCNLLLASTTQNSLIAGAETFTRHIGIWEEAVCRDDSGKFAQLIPTRVHFPQHFLYYYDIIQ